MMIICINCNADTKEKMDSLIWKGSYKDYSELVTIAIGNLWMLEHEVGEKGALIIPDGVSFSTALQTPLGTKRAIPSSDGRLNAASAHEKMALSAPPETPIPSPVRVPDLFIFEGLERLSVASAEIPPVKNVEEAFTLDRWLFGQYNKLLPIKVNCRALVRLNAGQENGGPLDIIACRSAEAAALLGDYLADHDRRHQIGRDDALSTAFPRSGPDTEKSRARYANQFVGSVNSQGILSGLLWDYRLAALAPGEGAYLKPTEPAIQFARMINPVLDSCQTEYTQKFSAEESRFILDHIRFHVPVERFAFQTLIKAIAAGADTPEKLDEALRGLVPNDSNRSFSRSFLASQRSGALSRMADICLIARVRKGVRVTYSVTGYGQSFIESM